MLRNAGHPFFYAGWGRDVVGMVLDDGTDWEEVAELLTESYCVLAPKKLVVLVDRPGRARAPWRSRSVRQCSGRSRTLTVSSLGVLSTYH